MAYQLLEHTADVRLRVTGANLEQAFASALAGMMAVLEPLGDAGPRTTVLELSLTAGDATALLVDFLNAVLTSALTRRERYTGVVFRRLESTGLEAALKGTEVTGFREDIKAVTYHEAHLRQLEGGGWETVIVCDV
jgi:SHS2 domain-containing protein